MKEYIEKGELLKDVEKFVPEDTIPLVRKVVEKQTPSEDVVEVVRCKDCEFYGENSLGVMFCTKPAGLVSTQRSNYCGYGKRKEQA